MGKRLTIIIPTKDRCHIVKRLLDSIKSLRGLVIVQPEIIVGDNNSKDQTWDMLQGEAKRFPVSLRTLKVSKPGKCAVLNEAIRSARGDILTCLDDDVTVDPKWLEALEEFFKDEHYMVAQGTIRLPSQILEDLENFRLFQRYRTISHLEYGSDVREVRSLNGANMTICRTVFDHVGYFDERLGPGASGTSEDSEFAKRILQGGIKIGYMKDAVVYHRFDRSRLTEAYFRSRHRHQGLSRAIYKRPSVLRVACNLAISSAKYGFYAMTSKERSKYRHKGRVYHYVGMLGYIFNGDRSSKDLA